MKFHVPPENQGQIVEISYSIDSGEGALKRVENRAERTVAYYQAKWTKALSDWAENGPWHESPPKATWKKIAEEQVVG